MKLKLCGDIPLKRNRPAFPSPATELQAAAGIEPWRGLSTRDYIATKFAAALMANSAFVGTSATIEKLRRLALEQADKFIEELGET